MLLATVGNRWIAVCHIYSKVGGRRFRCSDVDAELPMIKAYLKDMCDSGVLTKYKLVHAGRVHEYQLTPEAIVKIQRYGE